MSIKNYTKVREYVRLEEANFKNRLLFAQLTNEYDLYSESKFGYLDGAEYALKVDDIEALYRYAMSYKVNDEYDKAFVLAINDYIIHKVNEPLKGEIK